LIKRGGQQTGCLTSEQKRWTANRKYKQRAKEVDSEGESKQRAKEVDSEQVRLNSKQRRWTVNRRD
jgi:hypothetical protein